MTPRIPYLPGHLAYGIISHPAAIEKTCVVCRQPFTTVTRNQKTHAGECALARKRLMKRRWDVRKIVNDRKLD